MDEGCRLLPEMIEGKSGTRELIAYFCSGVNSASPKQPVRCTPKVDNRAVSPLQRHRTDHEEQKRQEKIDVRVDEEPVRETLRSEEQFQDGID